MEPTRVSLEAELAFQVAHASQIGELKATPEYVIERYRRCALWRLCAKEFVFKYLHDVGLDGREILDFGCGEGEVSTQLAKLGGRVTGIDICSELIACAERRAALDGVSDRVRFIVGDVREFPLEPDTFDILICSRVLHHVDRRSVPPLLAAVKPGGLAIMLEPIACSPLLQKFRDLTPVPKDYSPDERQLNKGDIDWLADLLLEPEITYFDMFARLSRLFPNRDRIDRGHPITKAALVCLAALDRLLLMLFPSLWKLCGTVVIIGRKPHLVFRS